MTSTTQHRSAISVSHVPTTRLTPGRVLRAETFKARTVRSSRWLLAGAVLSILAGGVTPALSVAVGGRAAGSGAVDPTGGALGGVSFTQLIAGGLGVLLVSNEYATGLIRSTFAAVPNRRMVLVSKVVVATGATFAASFAAVIASFLTAQAILAGTGVSLSLTAPGVLRAVVGGALLLALTAAMGVGFGWLLRGTAAAVGGIFTFLYLPPLLGLLVPSAGPFLPDNAGTAVLQTTAAEGSLSPWAGLALFAGYAAAVLVVAAVLVDRRDA
jgi:ABC-2 type transport system permease protein